MVITASDTKSRVSRLWKLLSNPSLFVFRSGMRVFIKSGCIYMAFSLTPQPRESVYNPVLGPGQKFSLTPNPVPVSAPSQPYVQAFDPASGRPAFGAPAYPFGQGYFQQTAPRGFSLTPAFAPMNPGTPFRPPNHHSVPSHHSRHSNHHSSHHSRHSNHNSRRNSRRNSRHSNHSRHPKPIDVCPSHGKEPRPCNDKKDYLKQSLIFHPDRNKGCQSEATVKFQTLQRLCAQVKGGKLKRTRKSRRP